MSVLEHIIRDTDNQVTMTLTEDGSAITGAWTGLSVWIGSVELDRVADADGITLSTSTGVLTINPGDLEAGEKTALAALTAGKRYRGRITVTTAVNDDGAVFGGDDSPSIYFVLSDKPA